MITYYNTTTVELSPERAAIASAIARAEDVLLSGIGDYLTRSITSYAPHSATLAGTSIVAASHEVSFAARSLLVKVGTKALFVR